MVEATSPLLVENHQNFPTEEGCQVKREGNNTTKQNEEDIAGGSKQKKKTAN